MGGDGGSSCVRGLAKMELAPGLRDGPAERELVPMHRFLPSVVVYRAESLSHATEASYAAARESAPDLLSGSMPPGLRVSPGAAVMWASAHLEAAAGQRR